MVNAYFYFLKLVLFSEIHFLIILRNTLFYRPLNLLFLLLKGKKLVHIKFSFRLKFNDYVSSFCLFERIVFVCFRSDRIKTVLPTVH